MIRLLFVCLGNICRSPAAEAVMRHLIEKNGLSEQVFCDSAGTAAYHGGEMADARMIKHAKRRGYEVTSIARRVYPMKDYEEFDYILAMDNANYRDLKSLEDHPGELDGKLFRMCEFCTTRKEAEVPDPYYEGAEGFERVLDILEDACQGLLDTRIRGDIAKSRTEARS